MVTKAKGLLRKPAFWLTVALIIFLSANAVQAFVHYNKARLFKDQITELTDSSLNLSENLARSKAVHVTVVDLKDAIDDLIEDNQALRADLAELKAKPTSVTYVLGSTGEETTETFRPNPGDTTSSDLLAWVPDIYEYRTPNGLPVARHELDRERQTFDATTAELQFESTTVLSAREDDSQVAHTQVRVVSSLDPENMVTLDTIESETKFVDTLKRSMRVAPHLNLGASVGGNFAAPPGLTVGVQAGVSPFAYGRTDRDNTLRFVNIRGEVGSQVGVGDGQSRPYIGVGIDPVLVNIGEFLPLLDDLWLGIGPTVDIIPGTEGVPTIGAGLSFGITSTI